MEVCAFDPSDYGEPIKFLIAIGNCRAYSKNWAYFGKGKMKQNFFKMCFLFKFLFSSPDHNQPFIILNSDIRFFINFILTHSSVSGNSSTGRWNNY